MLFDIIHLYLRGGSIIPYQNLESINIKNSYDLRQMPLEIIISPQSDTHTAKGTFIFDNDEKDDLKNEDYNRFELSFNNNVLTVTKKTTIKSTYNFTDDIISKVKIFNAGYLINNNNNLIINKNDGNNENVAIQKSTTDNVITVDLSTLNLKLSDIKNMTLSA